MLVLVIDTATPAVTTGVVSLDGAQQRVLAERVTLDARAHGELLTPQLLDATHDAGVTFGDIDAVVCGSGPGPYTGLRAGMATAGALGHALDVAVHPVCSLDAIAAQVDVQAVAGESYLVVTDARRREVYWAAYRRRPGSDPERIAEPDVRRPAELPEGFRAAAGHGAELYAETLGLEVLEPAYPGPRGLALAARAELGAGRPPAPLTPLYLRRPHAEAPGRRKRVSA